jgi:hypothetical protein
MSYTVTLPTRARNDFQRWINAYKRALVVVACIAALALITLAQVANDRLAGDADAPFAASASQAF